MAATHDQSIKDEAVKLHGRGMEAADIARQLNVGHNAVHSWLRDHELELLREIVGPLLTPAQIEKLEVHEFCYLYREMTEEELDALGGSIAEGGLEEQILVWLDPDRERHWIIDGRNRFHACRNRGIALGPADFKVVECDEAEARRKVDRLNLERRHLTPREQETHRAKRAMRAVDAARGEDGRVTRRARDEAARAHGVSSGTVAQVKQVADSSPELGEKLRKGEITIPDARREVGLIKPKVTRTEPKNRTTLEAYQEEYDEREAMKDADSDEAWVEGLPLYQKLSGKQRDIFGRAAINWRRTRAMREEWKEFLLMGTKGNQRPDPYTRRHIRALTCGDPADWDLCSAEDNGGCDGTGRVPDLGDRTRACRECDGDGFKVR